jgi:hypothetical protein
MHNKFADFLSYLGQAQWSRYKLALLRLFEESFGDPMLNCCCNKQHQCCKESPFFHHQLQSPTILIMLLWTQHIATHNLELNFYMNTKQSANTKKRTFKLLSHVLFKAMHYIWATWTSSTSLVPNGFCYEQQTTFKLLLIGRWKIEAIIWLHRILNLFLFPQCRWLLAIACDSMLRNK